MEFEILSSFHSLYSLELFFFMKPLACLEWTSPNHLWHCPPSIRMTTVTEIEIHSYGKNCQLSWATSDIIINYCRRSVFGTRAHQTRWSGQLLRLGFNEITQFLSKSKVLVALSVFSNPFFIPPQRSCRGVYWFHHVRPSVDKSYVVRREKDPFQFWRFSLLPFQSYWTWYDGK